MAEWIGHLLGQLPAWLFWPALISFIVVTAIAWLLYEFIITDSVIPTLRRRKHGENQTRTAG